VKNKNMNKHAFCKKLNKMIKKEGINS